MTDWFPVITFLAAVPMSLLAGLAIAELRHMRKMRELANHARLMRELCMQCDFKNGVTDGAGNYDEGACLYIAIMDDHRLAWRKAGFDITREIPGDSQ